MTKFGIKQFIDIFVFFIGFYMVFHFGGGAELTPPVLSGIALVLLGARGFFFGK